MIQVRLAEAAADIDLCLRLRWTVFVEEQGVRPSEELDGHDRAGAVHALAALDGVPCGAGRFIFTGPGVAKIQRMAVVDDVRGRGVGRALLSFLEEEARRRGAIRLTLWAQVRARVFYERAGYAVEGAEFDDGTGIPHVRMSKAA
jgi:predicted GNAT family N-acyltransferase